jgi:hypothetical protein
MARDATSILSEDGPEAYVESPDGSEHLVGVPGRRDTLLQRAEEEERPVLTIAEFQDYLKDPDTLYVEIVELITKTRDIQAHRDNYRQQLQETRKALRKSEAIVDKFLTQPLDQRRSESPAPDSRRTINLPDPPLFEGKTKDGITFDNWLIQVKNKLRGNSDLYPTEELKIIYVSSRVGSDALALISPRLNESSRYSYATVEDLYEHLKELYGDPNKVHNARQAFKGLVMQKGQTFQDFYAVFLRHVADGNISPDDLKHDLNDKLTLKLQEAVAIYYNDPNIRTTQFAKHCTTNDQQISARAGKKEQLFRKAEALENLSTRSFVRSRANIKDPSVEKAAAPRTSATDLKCYNCNEFGHISRECSKPRTERTKQALVAKLVAVSAAGTTGADQGNDSP